MFQPSSTGSGLSFAQGAFTTVKGARTASWKLDKNAFSGEITIPASQTGAVYLPISSAKCTVIIDGKRVSGVKVAGGFACVTGVAGGKHSFQVQN